jgi:hypothetical protein
MSLINQGANARRIVTERQGEKAQEPEQESPAPLPEPSPQSSSAEFVARAIQFVPTDIVGAYVSISGVVNSNRRKDQWIIYGGCLLLIPALLYFGSRAKAADGASVISRLFYLTLMGVFAFTAWVAALPSTPFIDLLGGNAPRWGTGSLIVLGLLLPRIATRWNLA